jgi:hypothetical protein
MGVCTRVTSGQPRGARAACAGNGSCAGGCTGADDACSYPTSAVVCGAACNGTCDGKGGCNGGTAGSCPGGFACNGTACRSSCSGNADCQTNYACSAPNCVRVPESDCLDGVDNNGDGLADCNDPTCAARVTCAPAASGGSDIGILTTGACSGDYNLSAPEHQGLQVIGCGDCACKLSTSCSAYYGHYSLPDCSTGASFSRTLDIVRTYVSQCQGGACTAMAEPTTVMCDGMTNPLSSDASMQFNAYSVGSSTCQATSGSVRGAKTWMTSKTFCGVVRQSATCAPAEVCIAKPPLSPLCTRIPGDSQACPLRYPNAAGTWWGDVSDNRVCACGACSSTPSCPDLFAGDHVVFYTSDPACTTYLGSTPNDGDVALTPPGTTTLCVNKAWSDGLIDLILVDATGNVSGGSCSIPGTLTSGSAGAISPSTICCQ